MIEHHGQKPRGDNAGCCRRTDDGDVIGGDGCSPTCQFEAVGLTCGDGATTGLERCDDNNLLNGDACNPTDWASKATNNL